MVEVAVGVKMFDPNSLEVEVTVRVKSAALWLGGVMVSPVRSLVVRVQVPSAFSVPWLSTAPDGMPEMVIAEMTSVLATSVVAAEMISGIAPSSLPWAPVTVTVGVLAMAATLTVMP